jgi:hypothetical protein
MSVSENKKKLIPKDSYQIQPLNFSIGKDLPIKDPHPQQGPTPPLGPEKSNPSPKVSRIDWSFEATGFSGGSSIRKGATLILWSWWAALIDGLILTSMSCFFMLSFSILTKTALNHVLFSIKNIPEVGTFFLFVFVVSSWLYLITTRAFLGCSIGEGTCGLRLGKPQERQASNYVLRVILRNTIVVVTGVVVLPILSLLSRKDLQGLISGVSLFDETQ